MQINLNKDKFKSIDNAFSVLLEDKENLAARNIIKENLEEVFKGSKFKVYIVDEANKNKISEECFVMSVYPELDTTIKIVDALLRNAEDKIVHELWKKNNSWIIEIDSGIVNKDLFTNRELSAMLLHEVGHIVVTNSIPNRICTILRYEVAKSNFKTKVLVKDRLFASIMSLPILDACISDKKKSTSDLKNEIKADTFAKKMGYSNELYSALTKLYKGSLRGASSDDSMKKIANFSLKTLGEIQARRENLAKRDMNLLREGSSSPYIESVIDDFYNKVFEVSGNSNMMLERKMDIIHERVDKDIEEGYITEFFLFGGKKLKRIDPTELDYIAVKMKQIQSESDKMMLLSYLHSKLDIIEYYMEILQSPKLSRKYAVPHSLSQLTNYRETLLRYRDSILNYRIPIMGKHVLVAWPNGYEG